MEGVCVLLSTLVACSPSTSRLAALGLYCEAPFLSKPQGQKNNDSKVPGKSSRHDLILNA